MLQITVVVLASKCLTVSFSEGENRNNQRKPLKAQERPTGTFADAGSLVPMHK
jgi:hypothetical protein